MTHKPFLALLTAFTRNTRGNIAVMFALLSLPVIGLAGAGLDFARAINAKAQLQAATDAAVVAGTRAGLDSLAAGASNSAAITAASSAAKGYFSANISSAISTTPSFTFTINSGQVVGTGTASASVQTSLTAVLGLTSLPFSVTSNSSGTAASYINVYLLVDISSSMLLPSTTAGINTMMSSTGCALACHYDQYNNDPYGYAVSHGITLRYQVVNQGISNLINYLNGNAVYQGKVKVGLWSFDNQLMKNADLTTNFNTIVSNFPSPGLAYNDDAAATPFNSLIGSFVSTVGAAGTGLSAQSPKKLVIIATDGVNDPTRSWTWNVPLRDQVRVFDTSFCQSFQSNGVTVAIINTPYFPMSWDWGYQATLGQPGSYGGATRVDDIPIQLKKCAGTNFILASDSAAIQSAFTNLFVNASPIRITN